MKKLHIKKPLFIRSKRGIAIEMVIIASLTIFALCSLLMLYTLKSISLGEYNSQVLNERLAIDQIGDDYLNYLNGELANFDTNGYTYKIKDREILRMIKVLS